MRSLIKKQFILLAIFLLGPALMNPLAAQESSDVPLLKDATTEELQDIIQSYEGKKAVLVNVWASWCGPCKEEFPDIVKLQKKYPEQLQVIFISTDFEETRSKAVEFLKDHNVTWTTYFHVGKKEKFIESISDKWTGAMPFTKIIDEDGSIVSQWENSADYDKFNKHVKKAIGS